MTQFANPVLSDDRGEDHGDPFVLRHRGEYFLFHTTNDGDSPISGHRSTDLVRWERAGHVLEPAGWAQTDLWAPEVVYADGEFLMYVSATTLGPDGHAVEGDRRQGLARSRSPLGPYRWDSEPLVRDAWSIDGHPFRASDGSHWLFYNVRAPNGTGNVVDRLLAPDRLAGGPVPVTFPSQPWEAREAGDRYWNEGAWVIERRGRFFQMYSGGFYLEPTYGVGVAIADHPRGPWSKDPANPLLRSGERITGPGHHCVVTAPDGVTPYAVYHAYDGGQPGRKVHIDRLWWLGDRPAVAAGRPTEDSQPLPPGPVHDPAVPHWHAELWARGELTIGGVAVALGDGLCHVRARQDPLGLRVQVDGRARLHERGEHAPVFGGEAEALALTSHLEDERQHRLAPGEPLRWAWGGDGPLEIALAVRGAARVQAGAADERIRSGGDRFSLLRVDVPGGAGDVVVEGDGEIADLVVTAR